MKSLRELLQPTAADLEYLSQADLQNRIITEILNVMEQRGVSRKDLAKKIGVSPSYISQVFSLSKPINVWLLSKIESSFDAKLALKLCLNETNAYNNFNSFFSDFLKFSDYSEQSQKALGSLPHNQEPRAQLSSPGDNTYALAA